MALEVIKILNKDQAEEIKTYKLKLESLNTKRCCIYLDISKPLFDLNIFNALMVLFLNAIHTLKRLYTSILKTTMYNLMEPRLDVILFERVFLLTCFDDGDQKLWDDDPHEHARKGYIYDLTTVQSNSKGGIHGFCQWVRKRGKKTFKNLSNS